MKNILLFGYLLTYFLLPIRRVIYEDWDATSWQASFFQLHTWTPLLALTYYIIVPKKEALDRFLNIGNLKTIVLIVLGIFLLLSIFKVAGWWWTWLTLGVHLTTIILVADLVKSRVSNTKAVLLGIGITSIAAGIWEIAYQIGYYNFFNRADNISVNHLITQVLFVTPLIIGGLAVLFALKVKITPNLLSVLFTLLGIITFILWVLLGFWVDIIYSWEQGKWVYTDYNYIQMVVYRASKSLLALGLILLYKVYPVDFGVRMLYNRLCS